jgi:WD40 repeat protein
MNSCRQTVASNQRSTVNIRLALLSLVLCVMSCNNVYAKKPIKKTSVKTHYALPINKPYSENKALNSRFLQASFASFQNTGDPGKNHGVNAIAYNPDGSTLAFVDNDGMLKLWNMAAASIEATAAAENYDGGGVGCVVLQSNDDCDISKRHKNLAGNLHV